MVLLSRMLLVPCCPHHLRPRTLPPPPTLSLTILCRASEGGARKKISDPILSFLSKLGTGVREGFLYTPDTPKKF